REVIGQNARAGQRIALVVRRLALVVGFGHDLVAGGDGFRLRGAEEAGTTAGIRQIVERDAVQAVTSGADFLVDLEAALERRAIIEAEWAFEREVLRLRRERLAQVFGLRDAGKSQERNEGEGESFHVRSPTRPGS